MNIKKIFLACSLLLIKTSLLSTESICIVIPAHNEESRIVPTLQAYSSYFADSDDCVELLVVCNNCKDNTFNVAQEEANKNCRIHVINFKEGGKGFAVKEGFKWSLKQNRYELIGFVDADMATQPEYFKDLITIAKKKNGAIASRYAKGAHVTPSRPFLKKIGGKMYNWMLRKQLNLPYKDTQCGAKIFDAETVSNITPHMEEKGWAFDLETLYLCKLFKKDIAEVPTTWHDQPGSHLVISSKLAKEFLASPKRIKKRHAALAKKLKNSFKK